jgi:hypothetical protein
LLAKVLAIEMEQIEGIEDYALGLPPHSEAQCLKVRNTVTVLDNGLTINNCGLAAEIGSGTDDGGETVSPIVSIPAKDTHLAAIKHHLRAITIVFDFVNPVLALRRLIDRGSKLWLDELEAGSYAEHERFVVGGRSLGKGGRTRNSQFC